MERIAVRHGHDAVVVHAAQQAPVDAGQSFLLDLKGQAVFDFNIGTRPEVERDQFGGTLAKAMRQIFAAADEILALLVLSANGDVGVDRKSRRLNSSQQSASRLPSSA